MKTTYDVIIWIATINRETHLIEPKDILIAKGLRTKRAAQKYIEFYKEEYYLYLIGKVKGLLQAVNVILSQRKEENEDDA